jgi:hypothetical protein
MYETWLRPNRRAIWFGAFLPLLVAAVAAYLAFGPSGSNYLSLRWVGLAMLLAAVVVLASLVRLHFRAPIGYRNGHVMFCLRTGPPIEVPVHVVEAFFLGQGPAHLPGDMKRREETVNLVARLSQRETDWAQREVKPALGSWCDGYITIRGTWCEPLNVDVIRRLNCRLKEVKTSTSQVPADAATI